MRRFLYRLFHRHAVAYYTERALFTRGACACGWEGDVDINGRFI